MKTFEITYKIRQPGYEDKDYKFYMQSTDKTSLQKELETMPYYMSGNFFNISVGKEVEESYLSKNTTETHKSWMWNHYVENYR